MNQAATFLNKGSTRFRQAKGGRHKDVPGLAKLSTANNQVYYHVGTAAFGCPSSEARPVLFAMPSL
jgi:hypothetical protein